MASKKSARSTKQSSESVPPPPVLGERLQTEELQRFRDEAWQLELELEAELLKDAVYQARLALQLLHTETYNGQRFERRKGLRVKEKAWRVEQAFNRLRALRRGDMVPPTSSFEE